MVIYLLYPLYQARIIISVPSVPLLYVPPFAFPTPPSIYLSSAMRPLVRVAVVSYSNRAKVR